MYRIARFLLQASFIEKDVKKYYILKYPTFQKSVQLSSKHILYVLKRHKIPQG